MVVVVVAVVDVLLVVLVLALVVFAVVVAVLAVYHTCYRMTKSSFRVMIRTSLMSLTSGIVV